MKASELYWQPTNCGGDFNAALVLNTGVEDFDDWIWLDGWLALNLISCEGSVGLGSDFTVVQPSKALSCLGEPSCFGV